MLNQPLPGVDGKTPAPFSEEEEAASFMAAMVELGQA